MFRLILVSMFLMVFASADGPVFKTGQSVSYSQDGSETGSWLHDDGFYQAGKSRSSQNYTRNGDIVTDNITGLQWQDDDHVVTAELQWSLADDYCRHLNIDNLREWRLPTMDELETLIVRGRRDPAMIEGVFQHIAPGNFTWTSIKDPTDPEAAWNIQLDNGLSGVIHLTTGDGTSTRCVRGDALEPTRLSRSGDIVRDSTTNLEWQDDATIATAEHGFEGAIASCDHLTLGGNTDWRLPNVNELVSITNHSKYSPAMDTGGGGFENFSSGSGYFNWTSTTYDGNKAQAWCPNLMGGFGIWRDKTKIGYTRCVRGGQLNKPKPPIISGAENEEFYVWAPDNVAHTALSQPEDTAIGSDGSIYVVTVNNVKKLDSSGKLVKEWGGSGSGDGQFHHPKGIAIDSNGNVYVSDTRNHRIQKFSSDGTYLAQWGSSGSGNGKFDWPSGIAIDSSNNVYVVDTNNNRIQKFGSDGTYLAQWGSKGSGDGKFDWPTGIAIDSRNDVYVADSGNNRIQKFNDDGTYLIQWDNGFDLPQGIATSQDHGIVYVSDSGNQRIHSFIVLLDNTVHHVNTWGSAGSGDGEFNHPYGIATDSSNNVYVADYNNDRIQKFKPDTTFLAKWGNSGSGDGQFIWPRGIATDSSDSVYVADTRNNRIQKFDSDGTFRAEWLGKTPSENFSDPQGIATDSSDNVYVSDTHNHKIEKFDSNGSYLGITIGGSGDGNGQFRYPTGIAIDSSGNVYAVDNTNHRIQKFDSDGTYLAQWGSKGHDDGQFYYPNGIAIDSSGNVYVADTANYRIQKFDSDGTFITKWGYLGSGDDEFLHPFGISIDSSDNVYVADSGSSLIKKFSSDGTPLAKWGSVGSGEGQFSYPTGIAIDSSGSIYVADTSNNRIQKTREKTGFLPAIYYLLGM